MGRNALLTQMPVRPGILRTRCRGKTDLFDEVSVQFHLGNVELIK